MTSERGAPVLERLRALANDPSLVAVALEKLEQRIDEDAALVHAIAAQVRKREQELRETVALLPRRKPGPDPEEMPPELLQKVKTLHEERGWGRPRILKAMRAEGATEWQVRRALAQISGGVPGSRSRRSTG